MPLPKHHLRHPVLTSRLHRGSNPVLRLPWWSTRPREAREPMIRPLVLQFVVVRQPPYQVKQTLPLHVGLPLTT